MLQESGVLNDLRRVAFYNRDPLCLYGDSAYPLGLHLKAAFRNFHLNLEMVAYNKAMSEVRVAVEWLFGKISSYFNCIGINLSAVGKFYIFCALLENAHNCL